MTALVRFLATALAAAAWTSPALTAGSPRPVSVESSRSVVALDGAWEFRRDGDPQGVWKTVQVPSCFEEHEGTSFDGVGWYRRDVIVPPPASGRRVFLQFDAVATGAEVRWDGRVVGRHLGGWTPFRCEITELLRTEPGSPAADGATRHRVLVRVDEKVGHNTQGFLPVIAPHFGGLWKTVRLLHVPTTSIDDTGVLAVGDARGSRLLLEVPVTVGDLPVTAVEVQYRPRGESPWISSRHPIADPPGESGGALALQVPVPTSRLHLWSPRSPRLYDVRLTLLHGVARGDSVTTRAAFRTVEARGRRLLLNGEPLVVRGVLNWGYYPPGLAPDPDEAACRRDLELARSLGFNLVKFCLWVPPRRFLELADEMGMLTWMEYPTWHPSLTAGHLPDLEKEFGEFFRHDRNHPSVVLRSLTCETGSGADLEVIRKLYGMAKELIPGCLVEDDSSWIGWNRVHDFWDDHPYGNNHTWVARLSGLDTHIREHGAKPLVLGEAIAADTWVDPEPLLEAVGEARPFWLPGFLVDNARWLERMEELAGPTAVARLSPESRRYAHLMRKFQIETFRRELPRAGYVVSVIRDFPLAAMGLVDYLGRPKWGPADWSWHGDTMCLLETEDDARGFRGGEAVRAEVKIAHVGPRDLEPGRLTARLVPVDGAESGRSTAGLALEVSVPAQERGSLLGAAIIDWVLPVVQRPVPRELRVELRHGDSGEPTARNEWTLWLLPRDDPSGDVSIGLDPTVPAELGGALWPAAPRIGDELPPRGIVVTRRLSRALLDWVEGGGGLLVLPDGERGSFPLRAHWFLRGGPCVARHPITDRVSRALFVDLQHFDLAGDVVLDIGYLEDIDPVVMLWDNHDLDVVKTHGLLFETRVGAGRMLVCSLGLGGRAGATGRFLARVLTAHLAYGAPPRHGLTADRRRRLREKLTEARIELTSRAWLFRPDPRDRGLEEGWHRPEVAPRDAWGAIRVGSAWEAQGHRTLDGWAWYRIDVEVPEAWRGLRVYLSFEGVDDYYELYVGGRLAGSGGDLETRRTAFEERKSHDITGLVEPGTTVCIAVRVYDWFGAGGIFRPVTLATVGFPADGVEILR